ncbi:hypothetical protein [Halovivax limisalsi]|uniref:hypothetical protein n=1 Tax=Halovivax limisalsi TaxID=1453760 RepID=UPI001FFD944F|nr:hypothetical protein [Halovivax limisalsi]
MAPAPNRTHDLLCATFAGPLASTLELILPAATAAIVHVDAAELEPPPDGGDCRRTWRSVRPQLERLPEADRTATTAWRWDPTSDAGRAVLFDLVSLTDGGTGAYFVRELELRIGGERVLTAVPHHLDAGLDATRCGSQLGREGVVDIPDEAACLVPTKPAAEWVVDDRRWKLAAGSLCVERRDGRRAGCYDLSNLQAVSIASDGTLELSWDAGPVGDDAIGRALTWMLNRIYRPPTSVPCPDRERAETVRAQLQEILDAYDGREL